MLFQPQKNVTLRLWNESVKKLDGTILSNNWRPLPSSP